MTKKLSIFKKNRQLILYGTIGATGALIDLLFYIFFYQALNIPPFVASFLSVSLGIVNNFILNKKYNFKTSDHTFARFANFYLIGCGGAILSAILIFILFNIFHIDATVAKVATIIPIVLLQYYINKKVSFSDDPKKLFVFLGRIFKLYWVDLLLAAFVAFIFAMSTFYLPAVDDMDNMLSGKLILQGQLPYVDFFSHHTPGMYFLSALIYPFTNNDVFVYRLLFNSLLYTMAIIIYILLKKYTDKITAVAYLVLIAFAHNTAWSHLPVGESLVAMIMSLLVLLIFLKNRFEQLTLRHQVSISLLLFMIPFFSLSYIFPALILYLVHFIIIITCSRRRRFIDGITAVVIYAIPYAILFCALITTHALADMKYDLLDFNSTYYAPMVGEQGGILKTFVSMVSNTISQIGIVSMNIFNLQYLNQTLLLFGIILFGFYLWAKNKKIEALFIPILLLLLNTRSNTFNAPAISSQLENLSQHASVYLGVAILMGSISTVYFLKISHNNILKLACSLYLIITFVVLLGIWTTRTVSMFTDQKAANYYTYAKNIKVNNKATIINQFTSKTDSAWIAPVDFVSQLYMEPQRLSRYTFYLPWLDASPKIRNELINSLKKTQPKIIYFANYKADNKAEYSAQIMDYVNGNYFTVADERLAYYYFNNAYKDQILKEMKQYGYQTN